MAKRILGVLLFKSATYGELAKDPAATGQAAIIVAFSLLVAGFFNGFIIKDSPSSAVRSSLSLGLAEAAATIIVGFIAWIIVAWILALIVKLLKGRTNTGEMLRITGYVEIFGIFAFLTILALASPSLAGVVEIVALVTGFLALLGLIIGIVEVSGLSTGKAFCASLITELITLGLTLASLSFIFRILKIGG